MIRRYSRLLPGIGLLVAGAGLARGLSATVLGLNELLVAVGLGMVVGNTVGVPEWASNGVDTQKLWLETGIVLMGARIAIGQLFAVGVELLALVVGFLIFSLLFVEMIARNVFRINERLGSLLAAGYSICGVSAIVAVSGGIKAKSEQIAYAVATILLFDAVTLAVYPVVGRVLALPDIVFGTWAGVSMVSTGPVVAAGFAYSPQAGEWATVTKLGRNIFIGVVAVLYAIYYARRHDDGQADGVSWRYFWAQFPKFVVGFVLMATIASLGWLSSTDVALLESAYQGLFLVAFVGLGMEIDLREMRSTGIRPVVVVLSALLVVSVLSLVSSFVLFG
ncbi:putative sulfate exporter family transporter [Halorhabdus sp. CBA1104]|uniref:YeiH family protein n=1 Tax=Halorhabdus sp. CBA1104 TaxID=1380432 RepID=UPI0012B2B164|nr:putative sulfate exporter family transporter [Halorhabdus sp. CBA1104]QGN06734.1 putative sulfate exporter family transporter [Halorhabdus sp. CBA1104]